VRKGLAALCLILVVVVVVLVAASDDETATRFAHLERVIQDDQAFLHQPDSLTENLDEIRGLGFTRLRVTANWDNLAPAPKAKVKPAFDATDPAAYDALGSPFWASLDRVVREAAVRDIALLIDVGFWAPRWAAEPTARGSTKKLRTDIATADYADFARALVERYSGDYAPPGQDELPRVDMFSIWNEPNIAGFLLPQWQRRGKRRVPASPHLYRAMIAAAYPAIKEARPDATVLVGGLASGGSYDTAGLRGGVPPLAFLRELACVDGALEPITRSGCDRFEPIAGDGLSIHPYSFGASPEESGGRDNLHLGDLGRLIDLLKALAERGRIDPKLVEIYVTEFGYKTNPPDRSGVSPEEQLRLWLRSEEIAASHPEVKMFAQFLIRDSVCRGCLYWPTGYRYADGRPKPLMEGLRNPTGN
jgi:hypothetical protein